MDNAAQAGGGCLTRAGPADWEVAWAAAGPRWTNRVRSLG